MKCSGLREPALSWLLVLGVTILLSGCRPLRPLISTPNSGTPRAVKPEAKTGAALVEVAVSENLWTGIAISGAGRIFVCFPRWSDDVPVSVGEVMESGRIRPFPDTTWNHWEASAAPGKHFVCVQSVYIDRQDHLWILDSASPHLNGVVPGGAKLVKADIDDGKILQTITFDERIVPPAGYLDDVRIDTGRDVAYITDSGLGALVVVDLDTGKARRLLTDHASTKAEDVVLAIGGKEWRPGGQAPRVHADGLALSGDGEYLYYHALAGRTLYRIETRWLRDATLTEQELGARVESLYETCAADGMGIGPDGYLYLTSIEDDSIRLFLALGKLETVVRDVRLKRPGSIAWGRDGHMYVTTSQIHPGDRVREPHRIFKIAMPD